jgi:hypothetical protein
MMDAAEVMAGFEKFWKEHGELVSSIRGSEAKLAFQLAFTQGMKLGLEDVHKELLKVAKGPVIKGK